MSSNQECDNCHSTSLENIDGLFYCQNCGTQNRTLRETETEMPDNIAGFQSMLRLRIKGPTRNNGGKQQKEVIQFDKFSTHRIFPDEDYPGYLGRAGSRLTTATYLIVKISTILHTQFGMPPDVVDAAYSLFQSYLCEIGVAFTNDEVAADENDSFIYEWKKNMKEIKAERKVQRQKLKEDETNRLREERSQLPMWQQSFLEQTQVEEEVETEHLMDIEMIKTINTGLSKKSFRLANFSVLNIDFLLVVVYLACQSVGCTWVLLSDLHRWHRENRFKVWAKHINDLAVVAHVKKETCIGEQFARDFENIAFRTVCTSEAYQALSFFIQVVNVPRVIHLPSIEKVLHRLLFDLNLPACLWSRICIVLKYLPNVTTCIDAEYLKQSREFLTGDALASQLLDPVRPKHKKSNIFDTVFYDNVTMKRDGVSRLAIMPIETKAAAIIMLTLKLIFALDDSTEYDIDRCSGETRNNFKFEDWLYQVEFRNHARNGVSIENILNPTFTVQDLMSERPIYTSVGITGMMRKPDDSALVVPKRTYDGTSDHPFFKCFPADHPDKKDFHTDLARYAPLRYYGTHGLNIGSGTPGVDRRRHLIYLHDFNKTQMDFSSLASITPSGLPQNLVEYDLEWRNQFPGLPNFKRIPQSMRLSFWEVGESEPQIRMYFLRNRLRDERRTFSKTFDRLLTTMSMLIGERPEVLYMAFTFVESMFPCKEEFDDQRYTQTAMVSDVNREGEEDNSDWSSGESAGCDPGTERKSRFGHGVRLRFLEAKFLNYFRGRFW